MQNTNLINFLEKIIVSDQDQRPNIYQICNDEFIKNYIHDELEILHSINNGNNKILDQISRFNFTQLKNKLTSLKVRK